jgi:class 3 adenylate cyclase
MLGADLRSEVGAIFRSPWTERDGTVVPSDESLKLGNDAVNLEATVLYADMSGSTKMVDTNLHFVAAEFYKTFLHCAAKIIRSHDGVITAYDGDRIMAVFIGDFKNTRAVRAALKINYAMEYIIRPAKQHQYSANTTVLKHVVGIDTSKLFVAKTGVRGANDLVWVGRAANYAAKLSSLPDSYQTYITKQVYDAIVPEVKTWLDGRAMWEAVRWNTFDDRTIYQSTWWLNVDYNP